MPQKQNHVFRKQNIEGNEQGGSRWNKGIFMALLYHNLFVIVSRSFPRLSIFD
ncbi:hypothetical protein M153_1510008734 [Pseudoloma neurophilia]|uniref:Uncharacterized protein n=1 Tax=Pseudoloma neurophilia TaxID=146866 RepID=A0A0R0M742_9MICR|nr:hypothetical protein M153_1510008734 [Pseudoloma neurophilia]